MTKLKMIDQLNKILTTSTNTYDEIYLYELIKSTLMESREDFFVGDLLAYAYKHYPDKTALIYQDKKVTYTELLFRAILLSKKYTEQGVTARDHVLLYVENSLEFYVAYYAAWMLGSVVVPLNIYLHAKELAFIIQDAQPKIIFASQELKKNLDPTTPYVASKGWQTRENSAQDYKLENTHIFTQQDVDWQTPITKQTINEYITQLETNSQARLAYDELCLLLYTSGTTGKPKGVMLSSRNIITNAMQCMARFIKLGLRSDERFFCVLPLFHVFAQNTCIWLPILAGGSVIIVGKIDRRLILEGLTNKPTLFLGFPALYGLLCLMKTAPLENVKFFISGADMLPDKIRLGFAMIYGRKICAGYGLTEASPVVAVNIYNNEKDTTVVGCPLAHIDCEIRDNNGQKVDVGTIGTLWLRGDNIMLGYYKTPEATAQVLQDKWLNTGDLARINTNGLLDITGRSKDLIIHKGFNIYPQEIENILMSHPAVFKAAVVGKLEDGTGQVPIAYVAVKDFTEEQKTSLEHSLKKLCNNNLAPYKIPRKFICLTDLPMSATGKIDKKQIARLEQTD
ncbi:MAG: AMP-binding protein [bacterium]